MGKIKFDFDGPYMKQEANDVGAEEILGVAVGLGKMAKDADIDLDFVTLIMKQAYNDPDLKGCVLKEAPYGKFKI